MGISTIQSYCGAQIFEALGLKQSFVDKYFTWTPTRIEGIGLEEVYRRGGAAPSPSPSRSARSTGMCCPRAATTNGAATASVICSTRRRSTILQQAVPQRRLCDRSSSTRRWSTTRSREASTLRGLLEFKLRQRADPAGRSGAGRGDRQALQDGRHVLRLDQQRSARGAGHRHEPHRRQEQHRRRRRGPGPLYAWMPTATPATAPSSRWRPGASA